MPRRTAFACCAVLLLATACREGLPPYELPEGEALNVESLVQLTTNSGDDRYPAWSPSGDSLYYSAVGFIGTPPGPGVLLRISPTGGRAEVVLPSLHRALAVPHHVTPAPSPDGTRIAFVHVGAIAAPEVCLNLQLAAICSFPEPLLGSARLHVRPLNDLSQPELDPQSPFGYPGRAPGPRRAGETFSDVYYPYHVLFAEERTLPSRPSWSPDGTRVAFATGNELFLFDLQSNSVQAVPNTAGAAHAAWSPDGTRIAFSRFTPGTTESASCDCNLDRPWTSQRTRFTQVRREVVTVRADGSNVTVLAAGIEPAWINDQSIIVRRSNGLHVVTIATGNATLIPGTQGAVDAAVSPDGRTLAFARLSSPMNYDIWLAPLQP